MRFKKIIIAVSAVLVAVAAIAASIKISDINEEKENYRSDAKQLQRFIENTKERGTNVRTKLSKADELNMKSDAGKKMQSQLVEFYQIADQTAASMFASATYSYFGKSDTSGFDRLIKEYSDKISSIEVQARAMNNYCKSKKIGSEYLINLDDLDKALDCIGGK